MLFNDVQGGIFCKQEMPANKGDDVTILLRNTANLSGESFFGSLNVGVFDDSGALVTMGMRSVSRTITVNCWNFKAADYIPSTFQ